MKLQHYLKQFDRIAIALSGGADSACLLREAAAAVGREHILAVTVQTELLPARRLRMAKKIAQLADVEHVVLQIGALEDDAIQKNGPSSEYYCHRLILHTALDEAWMRGFGHVMDGHRADERNRPGFRAAEELHVFSPFAVCGMGRFQVAALRKGMAEDGTEGEGSLANRLPSGMPLTFEILSRIDEAEEELLRLGLTTARVVVEGNGARILVGEAEKERYDSLVERARSVTAKAGFGLAEEQSE
ncbi:MAG TPA: hypothetical protein VN366_11100 [Feifaniaceae bacterium]|nr:hypothetical protein [Feifaniaceae bacterium]